MEQENKTATALIKYGKLIVAVSVIGLFIVMFPAIRNEVSYFLSDKDIEKDVVLEETEDTPTKIVAKDKDFSIIVPKIGANSKVIKDINPQIKLEYLEALREGVAHAEGSAYPGEGGNTFLFAHSSDNFYNANRYNSVFYLLNKLVPGDNFYVVFENNIYKYEVSEAKNVDPSDIRYLSDDFGEDTVTLMTCWPPGTTLQRLLVIGKQVEN